MKIALVELSESHEECLYSQILFIIDKDHLNLHLFANQKIQSRIDKYHLKDEQIFEIRSVQGSMKNWLYAFELVKKFGQYDTLIFNTASSSKLLRNLAILLNFYTISCFGVLHNTKKLKRSFTQRLISTKIKKYFVLADHLKKTTHTNTNIQLQSFYPVFFPAYSAEVKKPKNKIWITIPGFIDFNRRAYYRLLNSLSNKPIIENIKIVLLGKLDSSSQEGRKLLNEIQSRNLEQYFICFKDFIPNDTYHAYLKQADFIMPLLILSNNYLKHKISGSFNMAYAYKKKLIVHEYFKSIADLYENSIFYNEDTFFGVLSNLKLNEKKEDLYKNEKWNFKVQQKRYLEFLFGEKE